MPQIPEQDRYVRDLVEAKAPGVQVEGSLDASSARRITVKTVFEGIIDHLPPLRHILRRDSNPQS